MWEKNNIIPFFPLGRFKSSRSKSLGQLSNSAACGPSVSPLLLWLMLGRLPVFIGLTGQATQTAISPNQTADLPLQPLCVSCSPDGDQMKSSADDNKKHGTKAQCEWGLSMMAPLFLSSHKIITTPQCAQLLKAGPCVSTFIQLMTVLFNTPSVKTQLTGMEASVQSSSV